jgi:hypothetical protein
LVIPPPLLRLRSLDEPEPRSLELDRPEPRSLELDPELLDRPDPRSLELELPDPRPLDLDELLLSSLLLPRICSVSRSRSPMLDPLLLESLPPLEPLPRMRSREPSACSIRDLRFWSMREDPPDPFSRKADAGEWSRYDRKL